MRKWMSGLLFSMVLLLVLPITVSAAGYNAPFTDPAMEKSYKEKMYSSVKLMGITNGEYFYSGTGWFIDDNTIATALHTTKLAPVTFVVAQNEEDFAVIPVTKVYEDKSKDLMFLKVSTKYKRDFELMQKLGHLDLADTLTIGDNMYSIGFPYSENWELTYTWGQYTSPSQLIQWEDRWTYAAEGSFTVTPGFSGAPILNTYGKVVGMVQGYSLQDTAVGLFLPISDIRSAYTAYLKQEDAKKATPVVQKATVVSVTKPSKK